MIDLCSVTDFVFFLKKQYDRSNTAASVIVLP